MYLGECKKLILHTFYLLPFNSELSFSPLGLDKIEFLQSHENREIYQKAFDMIERYFGSEEEDRAIAPEVDQNSEQFQFQAADNAPMGGFQF